MRRVRRREVRRSERSDAMVLRPRLGRVRVSKWSEPQATRPSTRKGSTKTTRLCLKVTSPPTQSPSSTSISSTPPRLQSSQALSHKTWHRAPEFLPETKIFRLPKFCSARVPNSMRGFLPRAPWTRILLRVGSVLRRMSAADLQPYFTAPSLTSKAIIILISLNFLASPRCTTPFAKSSS